MSVFESGKLGFRKNEANPFGKNSHSHKEWERGYNAAYFENLKKVQERERREATARG
jgi:hypothetical protein